MQGVLPGAAPGREVDASSPACDDSRLGDPTPTLPRLAGTVVIDEAQRRPDLFPVLRVLIDSDRRPGRFLVLGSASPDLVGLAAESLAGRITLLELGGFRPGDVGSERLGQLWVRGGLPLSYLAADDRRSVEWREDYLRTLLERDLVNLGFRVPATTMRRFWTMLAHYHAQTWNGSELARALGVAQPTVRRYLDALTDALVVRQLQPWFANVAKRQVRSPKVYVRDSGLLHRLLGVDSKYTLLGHPKVGASWEGFVIEQIIAQPDVNQPWFWATQAGAELDLLVTVGNQQIGIEVKRTDRPRVTPSMRHAMADLGLGRIVVVHAGADSFPIAEGIDAVAADRVLVEGLAAA
jgi:predicted AAA+ superfamily ATPase